MRHLIILIILIPVTAVVVAGQPDFAALDTAFDNSLSTAPTVSDPSMARRKALMDYETALRSSTLSLNQQVKILAQKCVMVADADFYAMYRYFLSDIKPAMMGATRLALPLDLRNLLQRHAQQTVNDYLAKQKGQSVVPLEQRLPPGVPWRTIASGVSLPAVSPNTTSPSGFIGSTVPMNPANFSEYIAGSWNVRIYDGNSVRYSETTWIFDIDGIATVRVDAKTKSPVTLRYWTSEHYSTYSRWTKVNFDYAGGRVELAQNGAFLSGSIKKGQASLKVEALKAPDLDYERWGDDAKSAKQFEAAEHYFSQAIKARPSDGYYVKRAHVRHERKLLGAAIDDLTIALKLNPNNATALFNRAVTYAEINDLQKALADVNRTVYLAPRFAPYYHLRGQIHRRLGKRDEAIRDFRSTLTYDPNHPEAKSDLIKYGVTP